MFVFLLSVLQSVESVFESQIMMKIGCCKLLEVLYSHLTKEEVYSKNSAINQAFCGTGSAEGNELSKNLLKYVLEIRMFLFFYLWEQMLYFIWSGDSVTLTSLCPFYVIQIIYIVVLKVISSQTGHYLFSSCWLWRNNSTTIKNEWAIPLNVFRSNTIKSQSQEFWSKLLQMP